MSSENEGPAPNEPLKGFTPRAQQALASARKEADRFNHNFVGTEHLLLGIIKLGQGTALNVLLRLGIDLESVRREIEKQVGTGPDQKMMGNIPYTPLVKKVLMFAQKEAKALNHTYVGTEHILLGLLREGDGVAARVLRNLGVEIETTRQEILRELDPNFPGIAPTTAKVEANRIAAPPSTQPEPIDTTKRYDVSCVEGDKGLAVYRNVLFKGAKFLLPGIRYDARAQFVELEQADGQTVFVALYSIVKFCESGATPRAPADSGVKPE